MLTKQESQTKLRAAYSEAYMTLRVGRAASAERQLRALQAAAPGDVNSLRLLGAALLYQDKTPEAVITLELAVASAPQFWAARADLARAYRAAGRLEEAREELRGVVAAGPARAAAWPGYRAV